MKHILFIFFAIFVVSTFVETAPSVRDDRDFSDDREVRQLPPGLSPENLLKIEELAALVKAHVHNQNNHGRQKRLLGGGGKGGGGLLDLGGLLNTVTGTAGNVLGGVLGGGKRKREIVDDSEFM